MQAPAGTLTTELKAALSEQKAHIVQLLRLIEAGWDREAAATILWFETNDFILEVPFPFPPGQVVDAQMFYESLRRDIQQGPGGPRAVALLEDLRHLQRLIDEKITPLPRSPPRPSHTPTVGGCL